MLDRDGLKGKIAEAGMSGKGVAGRLGVNEATFYRKLNGTSDFTRGEIERMAELLELSAEEIIGIFFRPRDG